MRSCAGKDGRTALGKLACIDRATDAWLPSLSISCVVARDSSTNYTRSYGSYQAVATDYWNGYVPDISMREQVRHHVNVHSLICQCGREIICVAGGDE